MVYEIKILLNFVQLLNILDKLVQYCYMKNLFLWFRCICFIAAYRNTYDARFSHYVKT